MAASVFCIYLFILLLCIYLISNTNIKTKPSFFNYTCEMQAVDISMMRGGIKVISVENKGLQ